MDISLDQEIVDIFTLHNQQEKLAILERLISEVYEFNTLQTFLPEDKELALENIETVAIDLTNMDVESSTIPSMIMELYFKAVYGYISNIGLTLNPNIDIVELTDLIDAFTVLLNLDPNMSDDILESLHDENLSNTEILIEVLQEYTNTSLVEVIEFAQMSVIADLEEYFKVKSNLQVIEDVDDNLTNNLTNIIVRDKFFLKTEFYRELLAGEVGQSQLDILLPKLFGILEKLEKDEYLVAYEIYMCLLLSRIPKDSYLETAREDIDLTTVSWIGDDEFKIKAYMSSLNEIVLATLGAISNEEA